jgi:hypothetical protein
VIDENIQEIIKQLYSQKNPIVFEYGAEEKGTIIIVTKFHETHAAI